MGSWFSIKNTHSHDIYVCYGWNNNLIAPFAIAGGVIVSAATAGGAAVVGGAIAATGAAAASSAIIGSVSIATKDEPSTGDHYNKKFGTEESVKNVTYSMPSGWEKTKSGGFDNWKKLKPGQSFKSSKLALSQNRRAYIVYCDPSTGKIWTANKCVWSAPGANGNHVYKSSDTKYFEFEKC